MPALKKKVLADVCHDLVARLKNTVEPGESISWQVPVQAFDLGKILTRVQGTIRFAFLTKNSDDEFVGFAAADIVDDLSHLMARCARLSNSQIYFGAMRFDEKAEVSDEWRSFGKKLFVLPVLLASRHKRAHQIGLNYLVDGALSWSQWLDVAISLLLAIAQTTETVFFRPDFSLAGYHPSKEEYFSKVTAALRLLQSHFQLKVVLGRRKSIALHNALDAAQLFLILKNKSPRACLFFFDSGDGSAFFGASPELLYRRENGKIETESLAGTRPRSSDEHLDEQLQKELLSSLKDNREHALVSMHIEEKLKDLGVVDLLVSELEIVSLSYVHHLLKRYEASLSHELSDAAILTALHPTPAVCGLDALWARDFIRQHEGFDRGFYAGPIGYIGNKKAEFAVAIRSALFHEQRLFVYAACGIVTGSQADQEWEELNNKEKNILSIFDMGT